MKSKTWSFNVSFEQILWIVLLSFISDFKSNFICWVSYVLAKNAQRIWTEQDCERFIFHKFSCSFIKYNLPDNFFFWKSRSCSCSCFHVTQKAMQLSFLFCFLALFFLLVVVFGRTFKRFFNQFFIPCYPGSVWPISGLFHWTH